MAENRAKHRARFDRGQGHPGTPFPSPPLQRSKTEPDVPISLRGNKIWGLCVERKFRGEDKVVFATVLHPGLPSQLFFQLINSSGAFLNLWRAGACCVGLNSFTSVCGQYSGYMDRVQSVLLGRHSGSRGHPWKSRPTRGTFSRESSYLPLSRRASAVLDQPGAGAFKCFRGNQFLPQPPDLTKRHLLLQQRGHCR